MGIEPSVLAEQNLFFDILEPAEDQSTITEMLCPRHSHHPPFLGDIAISLPINFPSKARRYLRKDDTSTLGGT
jgi:hypothetical protein